MCCYTLVITIIEICMTKMMSSVSKLLGFAAFSFLVLLSLFELSCCTGNGTVVVNNCPEIEKQSLLSLKQSLEDPADSLSSWNEQVSCCKWKGVVCSNLTGRVQQLQLQGSFLSGKISPSLLDLKHLKYLDLSRNQFNQTIPSFIGSLRSLEYLDLSLAFHGKIPHSMANLSNLHTLSLEYSSSLEVDSLEWLLSLSKLEYLNMNLVNLSKASNWPQQVITKLPSLVELRMSECSINFTAPLSVDVNNNITASNLAVLDLSAGSTDYQAATPTILPRWIFQLSNLIYLDLSGNFFKGPIPTVSNTTKLQHIDASSNLFNSSIPEWLYFLKDLEYLDLGTNSLQDAISSSIGNLTSLSTLDLSGNELSGKLPREITNLCKLQNLALSRNKLQGGVFDSFGNISHCFLGSLKSISLTENQLSGHITRQLGEFKCLRIVQLSNNSLSGVIPNNLGNLSSLEELYLQQNKLTGNLPESIGQLPNIQVIHIYNNMLEGVVSETHFANLSFLDELFASQNHLTLEVGPNWNPPFRLDYLQLGSWNLGSRFPSWLDTQKSIVDLDLSDTGIYGNVPDWIWSIGSLNLSHNQLHGQIPVISDPLEGYDQFMYLSSNNFSGRLPQVGKCLNELDLTDNSFSGDLSDFLCNTTTTYGLQNLHLGGNHLTGELPNCFMKLPSLRVLSLGNNNLSGRIPNSIGFLANLESLNLHGNKFLGDIPFSMRNCAKLLKIDLTGNMFSGNLPKWIMTSLSKLVILILKSNNFSGEITSAICQLSHLRILDLSHNRFSATIPRCLDNLTAMTTQNSLDVFRYSRYSDVFRESASIATKGKDMTYDIILALVTSIDLSKNNLSGDIPKEITSLLELRTLDLSGNQLTGLIPYSIGNMKQLESLDFSNNSLSGELPNSFTVMASVSYLNVSYNNLTGRIPKNTQLQSFNESSYIGNHLCGPPLTRSCSINGGTAPGTMHLKDEEGGEPKIEWLYVFISAGYAVGLSTFLSTLFLKRSWRQAYYEFLENTWDTVYVYFYIEWRRLTRALGRNI